MTIIYVLYISAILKNYVIFNTFKISLQYIPILEPI